MATEPRHSKPSTALALMAQRVSVTPQELEQTLINTVFRGATKPEFVMLVAVANKYDLDPLVREIYGFPKKGGGIVPLVPIDGWLKIIHRHPDYAGMDTRYADEMVVPVSGAKRCPEWIETTIYHKSTPEHPTVHREWIDEMYRNTGPWNETTKRMLEWKSIIQTGRKAFGLGGIFDEDEAERISSGEIIETTAEEVELLGADGWQKLIKAGAVIGMSEPDILANAAALGHEGRGAEMPREIAVRIYRAMKEAAGSDDGPDDDEPAGATQPAQEETIEGEVVPEAAETQAEPDEGSYWPTDDTPDPEGFVGMDAEQARAHWAAKDAAKAEQRPRSAAEAGRRAAENAERARAAKRIIQKQVNLLYAQCTIHGVDEKAQLHAWLRENIGVEHVPEIPAARFDEVLGWVQAHEKGGVAA